MQVLDIRHPIWEDLVRGKLDVQLSFLAGQLLVARWRGVLKSADTAANVEAAKKEVFELYLKNCHLPNAKADLAILLKQ